MSEYEAVLNDLAAKTRGLIRLSAIRPAGASGRAPSPERQWWNVQAKLSAAERIAAEEKARVSKAAKAAGDFDPHNDRFDAARHAAWSRRMAEEIDPVTSYVVGVGHEIAGALQGQPWAEAAMDLRNNAEGRAAARDRRAIDPARLQPGLGGPPPAGAAYQAPRLRP